MKKLLVIIAFLLIGYWSSAQNLAGTVVHDSLFATSLENPGGEHPTRSVSVYLPPGYENSNERYPVIYFLHGFTLTDKTMFTWGKLETQLNKAIQTGLIRPVILVVADHCTLYRGSMYTNSSLSGNWADFTAQDLVAYMDNTYRTIPNRSSRGIAGHSMGGYGALKVGMMFPDVFSSIYSLSPGGGGMVKEMGVKSFAYFRVTQIENREQLIEGLKEFYPNILVAAGRAFAPNPDNPLFYADLPYEYEEGKLQVNTSVLEKWQGHMLTSLLDQYGENLRKMTAIKLDWGRNEAHLHIPITCKMFSEKLENMGIDHFAEEYLGTHSNRVASDDGRILHEVLPFFDRFLAFGDEEMESEASR